MQTGEDYKMPIMLHPGAPHYEHNIRVLAASNPKHPRVVEYRKLMLDDSQEMEAELQDELAQDEQDDDAWCKEMVSRAEAQEEDEKPLSNDELERHFASGTGPFAD